MLQFAAVVVAAAIAVVAVAHLTYCRCAHKSQQHTHTHTHFSSLVCDCAKGHCGSWPAAATTAAAFSRVNSSHSSRLGQGLWLWLLLLLQPGNALKSVCNTLMAFHDISTTSTSISALTSATFTYFLPLPFLLLSHGSSSSRGSCSCCRFRLQQQQHFLHSAAPTATGQPMAVSSNCRRRLRQNVTHMNCQLWQCCLCCCCCRCQSCPCCCCCCCCFAHCFWHLVACFDFTLEMLSIASTKTCSWLRVRVACSKRVFSHERGQQQQMP